MRNPEKIQLESSRKTFKKEEPILKTIWTTTSLFAAFSFGTAVFTAPSLAVTERKITLWCDSSRNPFYDYDNCKKAIIERSNVLALTGSTLSAGIAALVIGHIACQRLIKLEETAAQNQ